jgi:plasmid stabilization system protein ParE
MAEQDLEEILAFIATESPEASFKVQRRFEDVFDLLGDNPALGHRREDLTHRPFRFFPVYSYLVIYIPDWDPIDIVRILSATRDLKRLLD